MHANSLLFSISSFGRYVCPPTASIEEAVSIFQDGFLVRLFVREFHVHPNHYYCMYMNTSCTEIAVIKGVRELQTFSV